MDAKGRWECAQLIVGELTAGSSGLLRTIRLRIRVVSGERKRGRHRMESINKPHWIIASRKTGDKVTRQ
jgi:hypothetical protein